MSRQRAKILKKIAPLLIWYNGRGSSRTRGGGGGCVGSGGDDGDCGWETFPNSIFKNSRSTAPAAAMLSL